MRPRSWMSSASPASSLGRGAVAAASAGRCVRCTLARACCRRPDARAWSGSRWRPARRRSPHGRRGRSRTPRPAGGSVRAGSAPAQPSCPGMWMSSSSRSNGLSAAGGQQRQGLLALAASAYQVGFWAAQSASRVRRRLRARVRHRRPECSWRFLREGRGGWQLAAIRRSSGAGSGAPGTGRPARRAEVGLHVVQQRQAGAHVGQGNAVAAGPHRPCWRARRAGCW